MYTATADLMLPSTVTGSWPRPRWFDVSMWGKPLDTCMLDVRFREKFQDAMAVVISEEERAGLDILTHGDYHCDEDMAGRAWHHYPLQRWAGLEGDHLQAEETRSEWLIYPPGTLLHEIYTGWRWPRVTDKIEHRSLDYAKIWRIAQQKTRPAGPLRHLLLAGDEPVPRYLHAQVQGQAGSHLGPRGGHEQGVVGPARRGLQVHPGRGALLHFMANTFGKDHEQTNFMIEAYNREVQGLDDVEIWIHTCWGNPNMQRVREDTSYAASIELYLEQCRGDVWTVEMKDRGFKDIEFFEPFKHDLKKKVAIGAVSHRTLQADRPQDVAGEIRRALKYIPPERLIVSSDCGFGRQGCTREIAFYKASAIAQGCNLVRCELGLPTTYVPAADPSLQIDIVSKSA